MITTVQQFDESTTFERWALSALVPMPQRLPHRGVWHRDRNTSVALAGSISVRVALGGTRELTVDLRPLAFGVAWKILDLMVELALWQSGDVQTPIVTIASKTKLASCSAGSCPPLSQDRDLWRVLTASYAATGEIRHSLIHRRADVDAATGTFIGRAKDGTTLEPLIGPQQEAFCRGVQRAAEAVISGGLTPRERSDLAAQLDELQPHHRLPPLGGATFQTPPLIVVPVQVADDRFTVDVAELQRAAVSHYPSSPQCDADFLLSDGRHFLAELEVIPHSQTVVDLRALPPWLQQWRDPVID